MDYRRERRVVSVDAGARVAEYELILALRASVRIADQTGGEPFWLEGSRYFPVDRTNLAGARAQEVLVEAELRADLAERLLRRVSALAESDSELNAQAAG